MQEFVHLPGGAAFSESNPIKAIYAVPVEGWIQILLAISLVELATFRKTYKSGADLEFDPMGMGAKDSSMRLKEVKVRYVCRNLVDVFRSDLERSKRTRRIGTAALDTD